MSSFKILKLTHLRQCQQLDLCPRNLTFVIRIAHVFWGFFCMTWIHKHFHIIVTFQQSGRFEDAIINSAFSHMLCVKLCVIESGICLPFGDG